MIAEESKSDVWTSIQDTRKNSCRSQANKHWYMFEFINGSKLIFFATETNQTFETAIDSDTKYLISLRALIEDRTGVHYYGFGEKLQKSTKWKVQTSSKWHT